MLHLVMSSVELIGQLMTVEQREHVVWRSWVAHVDYFLRLMQHQFEEASLRRLESSIVRAHKLFQQVPQFQKLWMPKHHFALHFVEDIRRYGPLRYIWCMRFESKNQEHKKAARTSNFHNVPGAIVDFWVTRSSLKLMRGIHGPHGAMFSVDRTCAQAVEPLHPAACWEHRCIWEILSRPEKSNVTISWFQSMRAPGWTMLKNSWIMIDDSESSGKWFAQVEALLTADNPLDENDTVAFVCARCVAKPEDVREGSSSVFGSWSVDSSHVQSRVHTRLFVCERVAMQELMMAMVDGVYHFVMSA